MHGGLDIDYVRFAEHHENCEEQREGDVRRRGVATLRYVPNAVTCRGCGLGLPSNGHPSIPERRNPNCPHYSSRLLYRQLAPFLSSLHHGRSRDEDAVAKHLYQIEIKAREQSRYSRVASASDDT